MQQFAPSAANNHGASTMAAAWYDTRLSPHTWGDLATQTSGGFGTSAPPTSGYPNVLVLDAPQGRHSGAPGIFGSWIADEQLASGVNVPYAQRGVLGNTPWGDYEGMAVDSSTNSFYPVWGDGRNLTAVTCATPSAGCASLLAMTQWRP